MLRDKSEGPLTDAEIDAAVDAMVDSWSNAPSLADFPLAETARLKADSNILGWIEHPLGEIYFNRDFQFSSPCHPYHGDILNTMFRSGPLQYIAAYGSPVCYYLSVAAQWARSPYCIKPGVVLDNETEADEQRLY